MKARLNPFRSDRVEDFRYRLDPKDWLEIDTNYQAFAFRASIVGPHGTGKTVFMEDFAARLQSQGWSLRPLTFRDTFSRQDRQRLKKVLFESPPDQTLLLVDGGELLPHRDWKWLLRRLPSNHGLLATLHQENLLPVIWKTRPQLPVAREMIRYLLQRPLLPEEEEKVDKRFHEFSGNIRTIVRSFYLDFAEAKTSPVPGFPKE